MSALKATLACDGPVFAAIQAIQAERDQLRAEVERLNALGSWAHTCIHHTDEERKAWVACPCCAIARAERAEAELASERGRLDYIRAELALLREWQREVIQNANAHHAERKDAIARAESAEREAFDWKKIARYETARAERAERELAKERARLDWLEKRGPWESWFQPAKEVSMLLRAPIRADIDAAMKEETK